MAYRNTKKNRNFARKNGRDFLLQYSVYLEGSAQPKVHQLHLRIVRHGLETDVLKLNIPMLWAGVRVGGGEGGAHLLRALLLDIWPSIMHPLQDENHSYS